MNTSDPLAQAHVLQTQGRHVEAREILSRLADQGDADAQAALGKSLLFREPIDYPRGIDLVLRATQANNAEALRLCSVLSASGAGMPQDWGAALGYLEASAQSGLAAAQGELRLLASMPGNDWKKLRENVDLDALLAPARMQLVHTRPRIAVVEKFLTPDFCDWLIARAKPKIGPAQMIDEEGVHYVGSQRNNSWAYFGLSELDIAFVIVRARIAALTGLPVSGFEKTQILHYAPGQRFVAHHDFFDPKLPAQRKMMDVLGQRVVTFLIYLNDGFDGAETGFMELNWRYRGNKGDAILFRNVDATGAPDPTTLHAGLAPLRGEKWLLSQWIRLAPSAGPARTS
ncbi:MAG TPA: 2OG-Fe(II) oxygenase [Rhizomicrobium sp.]|nr:2OG-Fe(II) oxygenase [Rhizomicrobium sp.]